MKSLLENALNAAENEQEKQPEGIRSFTAEDEELQKILQGLKTNIKIIGCGGGGSNTINRLAEAGIVGADLYAANTDAQHLLMTRAPHKILLGRREHEGPRGRGAPAGRRGGGQGGGGGHQEGPPELRHRLRHMRARRRDRHWLRTVRGARWPRSSARSPSRSAPTRSRPRGP